MNIILLFGGSRKSLWPLSNDVRTKQFLKIFTREDGTRESMVQRMYRMIKKIDSDATVTIATSVNQIPQIRTQIGEEVGISVEPTSRDTFPAIVLAAAYLKNNGVGKDEPVVVCSVDSYVNMDYFECLKDMSDEVGKANLTLMGIEPTYPSMKYEYIIPKSMEHISPVSEFKEKPDEETAKKYIAVNALWNSGVFAFRLEYLLNITRDLFGTDDYQQLYRVYDELPMISFYYAVVEKEKSINVIRFTGQWKKLDTWNTMSEVMVDSVSGSVTVDGCENAHVINELSIPLIALGIKDAVVAATPDGILVTDKDSSPRLKDYVASVRPMYERRSWGEYKVLDYKLRKDGNNSLVKELIISPGQHISYQRHRHRTEIWIFIEGIAELILGGKVKEVHRGDVAIITPRMKHSVRSETELHIIEVQIGDDLAEEDIERFDWDWKVDM